MLQQRFFLPEPSKKSVEQQNWSPFSPAASVFPPCKELDRYFKQGECQSDVSRFVLLSSYWRMGAEGQGLTQFKKKPNGGEK